MALLVELITFGVIVPIFMGVRRLARARGYFSLFVPGLSVFAYVIGLAVGQVAYPLFVDQGAEQLLNDPAQARISAPLGSDPTQPRIFAPRRYVVRFLSGLAGMAVVTLVTWFLPRTVSGWAIRLTRVVIYRFVGSILVITGLSVLILRSGGLTAWGFTTWLLIFFFMGAGRYCFKLAKKAGSRSVQEVLKFDSRPPILFLRSFSQDEEGAVRRRWQWSNLLFFLPSAWQINAALSFEEFISTAIEETLGPLVALGNPGEFLPSLGAATEQHTRWKAAIARWVRESRCIIVLEGFSPGLAWELKYLKDYADPGKVFILTPPEDISRDQSRVDEFWQALQKFGYKLPDGAIPGLGAVIAFDATWRGISLCAAARLQSNTLTQLETKSKWCMVRPLMNV